MKYLASALLIAGILLLAFALKPKSSVPGVHGLSAPRAGEARSRASHTEQAARVVDQRIANEKRAEQIVDNIVAAGHTDRAQMQYDRRTASFRFGDQLASVTYTCLEKYHRDSCIHHLIKCGPKCKAIIPNEKFVMIEQQYWQLMQERDLEQDR